MTTHLTTDMVCLDSIAIALPTFQEYILIDPSRVYVEQYCKLANKRWSYSQYDEEDTALVFNFFQVEVPLADMYEKVDFEAENEPEESVVAE